MATSSLSPQSSSGLREEELTPLIGESVASTTSIRINGQGTTQDEEDVGCMASPLCNPKKPLHRYFVLIFMCFLGFGSYFCYDGPGALQDEIETDMGISVAQFSALYAWYSWPNVILCFFGGFLIDRLFGIRLGAIIFSVFILLGQLIFAFGSFINLYWVMCLGRFVFGIGGESLAVAQNTYAVSWFKNKELNMVFGLQLSFARVGSTVNFNVMVPIYKAVNNHFSGHQTLGVTLFIAAVTCVFSFICALILAFFDKRAERILKKQAGQTGEVIKITDVKDFSLMFWIITLICVTYYVAIFPFTSLGGTFFQRKYKMSHYEANAIDSIIYFISAVLSPFLGFLVDFTGRNILWVLLATLITLLSHTILAFTFINPWFAMVLMGIGYSVLACALWPMVSLVVAEHQLGTAYGIMQSIQNLGLALIILAAGAVVELKGYIVLEVFFLGWVCLCIICVMILLVSDSNRGGFLNMSVSQRKIRAERLTAEEASRIQRDIVDETESEPVTPQDLLAIDSDFHIRNRYLSKIGAKDKPHQPSTDLHPSAPTSEWHSN